MLKLTLFEYSSDTAETDVIMVFVGDVESLRGQLIKELNLTASADYMNALLAQLDATQFAPGSEVFMDNGPVFRDSYRVAAL